MQPPGLKENEPVYLPRRMHVTGDIQVHEVAFAGEELWIVNTLFSALCTLDAEHSFVPRWHPPFVSSVGRADHCHLNGLAIDGGRPRFATALGESMAPAGWRETVRRGGVVIDVESGETVIRGLSLPHSPRVYEGRTYVLESGRGTLAVVDPAAGTAEAIAELPGFTRGLACAGPYAFVGLSAVRQSSTFGRTLLLDRVESPCCGLAVVDLRTGSIEATARFEGGAHEVFDVQVLPFRFPDLLDTSAALAGSTYLLPESSSLCGRGE
jgi:uncharacterized protein (TIGR03032 family)